VDGTIDGQFTGPVVVSMIDNELAQIIGVVQFSILPSLADGLGIRAGEYIGSYQLVNGEQIISGSFIPPATAPLDSVALTNPVPEPSTWALLGTVMMALVLKRWARR